MKFYKESESAIKVVVFGANIIVTFVVLVKLRLIFSKLRASAIKAICPLNQAQKLKLASADSMGYVTTISCMKKTRQRKDFHKKSHI